MFIHSPIVRCLQRDVRRMCLDATWRSSAAPSVQKSCWMTIRADRSELSSRLHANVLYATKYGVPLHLDPLDDAPLIRMEGGRRDRHNGRGPAWPAPQEVWSWVSFLLKEPFRKRQALVRRFIFSSLQGEDCLIYQSPRQSKKLAS